MFAEFSENLRQYYDQSFPYQLIHNWLKYQDGGQHCFRFREFSFTLPGDIYVRYQAFDSALELRGALLNKVPIKIDVGAVYNMSPKIARSYPNDFKPQQHELVFDIDISDYDDVRNCCKESNICDKCWPFMRIGAKVLHRVLTKEFGFKHMLFVFSGRRGFHCWVCDKEARNLGSDARKAIADYFSVVEGGQSMVKRVTLDFRAGIHPMILKALSVIDQEFDELMVKNQDFLGNPHLVQNVIDLCTDKGLQQKLSDSCKLQPLTSATRWDRMKTITENYKVSKKSRYLIHEVKLQHCFPRLDANVTKGFNHLLKLPFCVHPKTGSICVPIDINDIDNFNISSVPNLKGLTREALDPYVKIMKRFVEDLESAQPRKLN